MQEIHWVNLGYDYIISHDSIDDHKQIRSLQASGIGGIKITLKICFRTVICINSFNTQ